MALEEKGAVSPDHRPAPSKWIFTKEQMKCTASQKEGMSREEELTYRQMASAFIQEMIDGLNNVKDPKMRIGHTGICVAHTHMHRFYYWHSFKKYDYRDVGAACVFLAGKSHECPRKLSHVVGIWRDRKDRKQLATETARNEATQIIVLLESMILQTIAFDLNIILPHILVLQIMEKAKIVSSGKYTEEQCGKLKSTSFYFATDVIAVTDWTLRYSAASISIAVLSLMAAFSSMKMEKVFPGPKNGTPWYEQFDETMTPERLREMETDFMQTYSKVAQFHFASKYIPDFRENRPPPGASSSLENPDIKKIDRARDARSHSPMVPPPMPTPDSTVPNGRPRGYVPKDELTVERLNKERVQEEERRKRDHDRMAGRIDNSTSSEKRARIDPLSNNFVTSSSQNSTQSNGKSISGIPSNMNFPPPGYSNGQSRGQNQNHMMSNGRRQGPPQPHHAHSENIISSSVSPTFKPRVFDVEPMLTPPVVPKSRSDSDMDMEDGELA